MSAAEDRPPAVAAGRTYTLLVNPASGRGRARRRLPQVLAALRSPSLGIEVDLQLSTDYADARVRAERAAAASDALIVMGGDGMASIGLNACAGTDTPLGIIPAGTGNDFCRGVGLPGSIDGAVEVVAGDHTRRIDLMSVDGALLGGTDRRWVGSILSTGFDEKVNWRTNKLPFTLGAPSYVYSIITELRTFRPLRYRVVFDGVPRELDAILIAVGNAGVFGGGIRVCPDARVDDGLLDVTIVHPVNVRLLFQLFPKLFTGRFVEHPAIETLRVREAVVDGDGLFGMADGEDLGRPPFTCRAVPDAVRLFLPA